MSSTLAKIFNNKKSSSSTSVAPPSYETTVARPSPAKGPRTTAEKERDIALLMERYSGRKAETLPVYTKENVVFSDSKHIDGFERNFDKLAALNEFLNTASLPRPVPKKVSSKVPKVSVKKSEDAFDKNLDRMMAIDNFFNKNYPFASSVSTANGRR